MDSSDLHPSTVPPHSLDASTSGADRRRLGRARLSARIQFAGLGLLSGVWGAHIPSIKSHYALGEARLSLVMFTMACGALAAMFFAGRVVAWLGARRAMVAGAFAMGGAMAVSLLWPSLPWLLPSMVICGAAASVYDVTMNAEGSALEQIGGRAVVSGLHGMFSVGAMSGAALVGALLRAEVPALTQMLALCLVTVALVAASVPLMLRHPPQPASAGPQAHFAWPRGLLLLIGLLIFAGMISEGVMYDWSVLYLKQEQGLSQTLAAFGYSAFTGAMAVSRFAGDALRERFAEPKLVRASAALAALAMLLVLLGHSPALAFAGYVLIGAGLAPIVPILYNAAARVPGTSRAAGIAAVSSIGYSGFLIGPPLIGAIAQSLSLTVAMFIVVLGAGTLALCAHRLAAVP